MAVTINLNAVCYAPPSPTEPKLVEKNQTVINRQLKLNKNNPLAIDSEPDNIIKIVAGKSNAELEAERVEKERIENERIATEQNRRAERQAQPARTTTKSGTRRQTVFAGAGGITYLYRDSTNNCVTYAVNRLGIHRAIGDGGRAGIQGYKPRVGSIGVLRGYVHAVYVENISGEMITFSESNFVEGWITRRSLPANQFMGYIYN